MRDIKLYLRDIIEAMESIEKFVEGMEFEDFKPVPDRFRKMMTKHQVR